MGLRPPLVAPGIAAGAVVGALILTSSRRVFRLLRKTVRNIKQNDNQATSSTSAASSCSAANRIVRNRGETPLNSAQAATQPGPVEHEAPLVQSEVDDLQQKNIHLQATCNLLQQEVQDLRRIAFERDHLKEQNDILLSTAASAQAKVVEVEMQLHHLQSTIGDTQSVDQFHPAIFKSQILQLGAANTSSVASYGQLSAASEPRRAGIRQLFRSRAASAADPLESLPATPISVHSEAPAPDPHQVLQLLDSFHSGSSS